MNTITKRFTTLSALLMAGALTATPVLAEGVSVTGTSAGFTKTIEVGDAAAPNVTYSYAVANGTAKAATSTTLPVFAGSDGTHASGTPTIANVVFEAGDTKDGAKVVHNAVIDFSGVTFNTPGVYRYVITESGSATSVTEATDRTFACDVYVQYNAAGTALEIGGYVFHSDENTAAAADGTIGDKITGLTASYATNDLTISKTVTGNQGDRNAYFGFELKITGAMANTTYVIDTDNASNDDNPESITTGTDGSATVTVYLKNGESLTVKNLMKEAGYEVTENDDVYTTSIVTTGDTTNVDEDDIASVNSKAISDVHMSDATTVAYTNTKGGVVPTGLFMSIGGAAALTAIGGTGIVLMMRKKKDDEE